MEYRCLGRTGLGVSPLCLGTMGFGPPVQQTQVDELIHAALDLGVNFFDTANCYDGPNRGEVVVGHSETMLGKALAGGRRDDTVILTKGCVPMRPGPNHKGLSASHLLRELDGSLKRLGTDYVDIFMIHWPDAFAEVEQVLRTIDIALRSGRARAFGISNHQAWQVCEYLWQADLHHLPKVGVSEISLSILDRQHQNDLPFYVRHNIGVIPLQPLKAGLLSGIYTRAHRDRRLNLEQDTQNIPGWTQHPDEAMLDKLEALGALARELEVSLAELALAWVHAQPAVASVIVGARNPQELASGVKATTEVTIPEEILAGIDTIAPGPPRPTDRLRRRHREASTMGKGSA